MYANDLGEDEMKLEYEEDLRDFDPQDFWRTLRWNSQAPAGEAGVAEENASSKRKRQFSEIVPETDRTGRGKKKVKTEDAADDAEKTSPPPTATRTPDPTEPAIFDNPFHGTLSGKQNDESIDAFLSRIPPSFTTPTDIKDSWIWVANPTVAHNHTQQKIGNFKSAGFAVLEALGIQRAHLEAENPTKVPASITRLMKPYREGAEAQLAQLAKANGVTSGKWLLFPRVGEVDRVWKVVARATWEGGLGVSAKVAPMDPSGEEKKEDGERVVCIYTRDFADEADVKTVLVSMRELGLVRDAKDAKAVYYKCDFATYLDLMSGNEYKIPSSMYNSRELFKEMAKEKGTGRKKA